MAKQRPKKKGNSHEKALKRPALKKELKQQLRERKARAQRALELEAGKKERT